jgi:hypothetical protein
MIAKHKDMGQKAAKLCFIFLLISMTILIFLGKNMDATLSPILQGINGVGGLMYLASFWYFSKAKGYTGYFGLFLAMLGFIGMIILYYYADKHNGLDSC